MKCAAENRGRFDSAFRGVVGESGSVHHLVPTVAVEILDVDPTVEEETVAEAVRSYLRKEPSSEVKVFLTRKPFRGTRMAFVSLAGGAVRRDKLRRPALGNHIALCVMCTLTFFSVFLKTAFFKFVATIYQILLNG